MTLYSGDEYYDDDVTSGPIIDDDEIEEARYNVADVTHPRWHDGRRGGDD